MNRQLLTENPLISDATLRSPEVFGEMARRFYGRIYLTALGIVRQPDIAEDIAQETFLRAWLKRDTVTEPDLLLQPWLVRIATNLALQWLRTGQQRSRLLPLIPMEEMTVEPVDDTQPDPREAAGLAEQRGQMMDAVMTLPTELRQVVLLHYAEGLTPSDIARMNGESPSTVTRRLEKARAQLRQHLESGIATGLAVLKPRQRRAEKVFGVITAAAAIPAASRAQLLQLAADTPPPPMIDAVTSAAHAAHLEEAGIMNSIIVKAGAAKLAAALAVTVALGGGVYGVKALVDDNNSGAANAKHVNARQTRVSVIGASDKNSALPTASTRKLARARQSGSATAGDGTRTPSEYSASAGIVAAAEASVTTSPSETMAGYVTVRGKVSDQETSRPLAGAVVRAVAPAKDMRTLREYTNAVKLPATKANENGHYELLVPMPATAKAVALDAFYPGYESVSGTYTAGGDFSKANILAVPGQVIAADLNLRSALYISGQVVDEEGSPVANAKLSGSLRGESGEGNVAITSTNENGRFELFDFPHQDHWLVRGRKGHVEIRSHDYVTTSVPDIYQIPLEQLQDLKVVLAQGNSLRGQLLNASGKPAASVPVHIVYDYAGTFRGERRDVVTDAGGYFHLKGLPDGNAQLYARSMKLDQRLKLDLTVPAPGDMTLNMVSTPYADTSKAVKLLGMELIDVTPELAEKYDLYSINTGVLVLDPGTEFRRLKIATEEEPLHEGAVFWMAGNKRTANLKEFVTEILRVNTLPVPQGFVDEGHVGSVRVVYNRNCTFSDSSNTQYMNLTPEDIAELEEFVVREE